MSAPNSGKQDLSGASGAQKPISYNTRSKVFDNSNDGYQSYEAATSRRQQRKANPKPPVVPNNRRVSAAEQDILQNLNHKLLSPQWLLLLPWTWV